jgi:hypothetical protein
MTKELDKVLLWCLGAAALFWLVIIPAIGFIWGWPIAGWIAAGLFGLGGIAWLIEWGVNYFERKLS